MAINIRKVFEEGFFIRDIFGLLPTAFTSVVGSVFVGWSVIPTWGWGLGLLAAVAMASFIVGLRNNWTKFQNEQRLVGSVHFKDVEIRDNGLDSVLYLEAVNGSNGPRFVQVEEIQKTTQCSPKKWEIVSEKWEHSFRIPENGCERFAISHLARILISADEVRNAKSHIGHAHYRVKMRVGKTESSLSSGMICEFYANPPLFVADDDGSKFTMQGGGAITGVRYNHRPISDWPSGFGMTCEEIKA